MKFFLDTANLEQIRAAHDMGLLDGVTTNPSLVARENMDFKTLVGEICRITSGPVSAEVLSTETAGMVEEALALSKIAENVVIKLPTIPDGLKACVQLRERGVAINMTLCFQPNQALCIAKAGATYCSPFLGRLDDIGHDGMDLIPIIRQIYDNYGFDTQILAASLRHPLHVVQAAMAGADVATMPYNVFEKMLNHPLTDIGLERFISDFKKAQK
ncbi:MAG: fructose-6-phosphate aldolase [Phycisphaerales bacterium]|nr:MAG: fructose-6-phosphate aldolase [Phycisphaerales bacterium]